MLSTGTELALEEKGDFFVAHLEKTTQKTPTKHAIVDILKHSPGLTRKEQAEVLGKSESTIKEHLARLKNDGIIKRVGSDRSGHWEIL